MPVVPDIDGPLSEGDLDRLFVPLGRYEKLALAVSGGADSFALLHFYRQWSRRHEGAPSAVVLTVDHQLRSEAADEARVVAKRCEAYGLEHRILRWHGHKPASGIQKAAREARFALMRAAMRSCGAEALVLAHHRDDQAETFLDRLARGSGPYGLAAMSKVAERDGVTLFRPLLDLPKTRLVASLQAAGLDWCEDPSNDDARYRRVVMRKLLPALDDAGLGADRLAATARAMARAADALDAWVDTLMGTHVERHGAGPCRFKVAALAGLPEEIVLRLFARLVRESSGATYVPRLSALEAAVTDLLSGGEPDQARIKRTLGHCVLQRRGDTILICREFGRQPPRAIDLAPGESRIWDHRYEFALGVAASQAVRVGALGEGGLRRAGLDPSTGWPRSLFESAPAVHAGGKLVALPGFILPGCDEWPLVLQTRRIAAKSARIGASSR